MRETAPGEWRERKHPIEERLDIECALASCESGIVITRAPEGEIQYQILGEIGVTDALGLLRYAEWLLLKSDD